MNPDKIAISPLTIQRKAAAVEQITSTCARSAAVRENWRTSDPRQVSFSALITRYRQCEPHTEATCLSKHATTPPRAPVTVSKKCQRHNHSVHSVQLGIARESTPSTNPPAVRESLHSRSQARDDIEFPWGGFFFCSLMDETDFSSEGLEALEQASGM